MEGRFQNLCKPTSATPPLQTHLIKPTSFNTRATVTHADAVEGRFQSLRDRRGLVIRGTPRGGGSGGQQLQVTFQTDDMDLAGELVQVRGGLLGGGRGSGVGW